MIQKLEPSHNTKIYPLLEEMDIHLPLAAILAGDITAEVYVDNPANPGFALAWTGHRFYLAGLPPAPASLVEIQRIFLDEHCPHVQKLGIDMFSIYYPVGAQKSEWEHSIVSMLGERDPIQVERQYYARPPTGTNGQKGRERVVLPEGFDLRLVDSALLAGGRIKNPAYLTQEMLSERPSVDDFLKKSFGLCLVHEDEIIGWCLSEYNTGSCCEIGIATRDDFQRRGFATLMTRAFIELALSRGVTHIGWHCSAENLASGATARKAGLQKVADYPVYIGWFDPAFNLAVNGHYAMLGQKYPSALNFFERSFSLGELPDWAYWTAACAAARLGYVDAAFGYLDQAIAHGFRDLERLRSSEHLSSLQNHPSWRALVAKLEQAQSKE